MDKKLGLVESYGTTFRDLINAKVAVAEEGIRKALKLSKNEDWAFLCSAMDIIGDACLAIDHFLRFGLDGPTKYDDTGERYLRLYGILSATYIQQQAVLKLYQLVNVPPTLKDGKKMIETLKIRILRHQLSSHSTNYLDVESGDIETYVPIRMDLTGFNCGYFNNKKNKMYSVDLQEAINQHLETLIEMQDRILKKAIGTFYKGETASEGHREFSEKLRELQIERHGGLVTKLRDGTKFIITMAPIKDTKQTDLK
ncbi:MAG: hypothetical protein KA801_02270 [Syntrophorhabdaceae bacterium]|nr:hypothetical protein [Syntrophorhabdaceae bacterium]